MANENDLDERLERNYHHLDNNLKRSQSITSQVSLWKSSLEVLETLYLQNQKMIQQYDEMIDELRDIKNHLQKS